MISVDALTAYPMSTPGPRVRLAEFVEPLSRHGVELRVQSSLTDQEYAAISSTAPYREKVGAVIRGASRTVRRSVDGDLMLVHRLLSIAPIPGADPPRRVDAYDFDDALQLGSRGINNSSAAALKREAARWRSYVGHARLVVAGNRYLADAALEAGARRVEVVPSCVDPSSYVRRAHAEAEEVTVGWIGSASTAPYLDVVIEAMQRLVDAGVRARLLVVGSGAADERPWIESREWSLERQASDLAEFDIGVMPLPDNPWTRGKCGYKLLQYFAAGLPVVASPVGVAAEMAGVERARTATTAAEWRSAISELLVDHRLRADLGGAGRRFVEEEYSFGRWAPDLAAMLIDLT